MSDAYLTPEPRTPENPGGHNRTPSEIDRDERKRLNREQGSNKGNLLPVSILVALTAVACANALARLID